MMPPTPAPRKWTKSTSPPSTTAPTNRVRSNSDDVRRSKSTLLHCVIFLVFCFLAIICNTYCLICSSSPCSTVWAENEAGTKGEVCRVTSAGRSVPNLWRWRVTSVSCAMSRHTGAETSCFHTDGLFFACAVALLLLVSWLSAVQPLWRLTLYWFTRLTHSLANESAVKRGVHVTLSSPRLSCTFCTFTIDNGVDYPD